MSRYEPPIFVCGLPRSGSTLLELTISRSPDVLRLAESIYLSPWRRDFRYFLRTRVGDLSRDENLRKMVDIIFSEHDDIPGIATTFWRLRGIKAIGEERLKQTVFERLKDTDRSLSTIYRVLLQAITEFNGCKRCCVAFPVHPHYLPTLMDWFPDATFVFLTRDPRAVAISKTNDPGGTAIYNKRWPYLKYFIRKAMIAFVTVQYIQASRAHVKMQGRPNYLLVSYEDMVMKPVETMKRVCALAGLEFTDEMLEQTADRAQRSSITGELRLKADPTAASTWKKVITPFEKALVTMLTRRSMVRFGVDYDTHPVYAVAVDGTRTAVNSSTT
jgi:hypothetical protein